MNPNPNKITLNIDGDTKVSIKGFIAPIEHTLSNYHVEFEWDELANLRVAVPEKGVFGIRFSRVFTKRSGVCWKSLAD